jgi:hypothetical protein
VAGGPVADPRQVFALGFQGELSAESCYCKGRGGRGARGSGDVDKRLFRQIVLQALDVLQNADQLGALISVPREHVLDLDQFVCDCKHRSVSSVHDWILQPGNRPKRLMLPEITIA